MARKISGGLVGQPSVGAINVASTSVITARENQNITISPTGTAAVVVTNNLQLDAQNDLRFADSDSSNWVAFQAADTIASNVTWTLPASDGGNTQVLSTNGSGVLTWATPGITVTDNTSDSATHYVAITTSTSGSITGARISTTKLSFQPSTGILTSSELTVNGTARSLRLENIKTASHVLELADRDKIVFFTGASNQTVTVPNDSTTDFPVGSVVYIARQGTGQVDLLADGGVTVRTGRFTNSEEIYLRKRAANTWFVVDVDAVLVASASSGGSVSDSGGLRTHQFTSIGSASFSVST